jgi:hypothetical protein
MLSTAELAGLIVIFTNDCDRATEGNTTSKHTAVFRNTVSPFLLGFDTGSPSLVP